MESRAGGWIGQSANSIASATGAEHNYRMNRSMQTVETLFAELRLLKIGDFRTRGPHMPLELASTIKAVCHVFAGAGPEERSALISLVQPSFSFVFLWFAKAMAIQAVRQNSRQAIVDGVTARLVENCTFDGRDSTVPLALLCHSAEKRVEHESALHKCSANDESNSHTISPWISTTATSDTVDCGVWVGRRRRQ